MSESDAEAPSVLIYADIDWDDPLRSGTESTRPPEELVLEARKVGARRKKIVTGQAGFFMNRSVLPPGFTVPLHTHNHDELIVVLGGGCTLLDTDIQLGADDTVAIRGDYKYGFTCGPDGMEFLTIRRGDAGTTLED